MILIDVDGMKKMKNGKTYKRTVYWLNTTFGCGAVAVDQDGCVYKWDTCPLYNSVFKSEPFWRKLDQLKRTKKMIGMVKLDVEVDPF